MMHEYERLYRLSPKPSRLRIFIFPTQNQSLNSSSRSFGSDEVKSEKERFVEALNTAPIITAPPQSAAAAVAPQPQPPANNVDFLFGLEKANAMAAQASSQQPVVGRVPEVEDPVVPGVDERFMGLDPIQKHIQDLQRLRLEEQQGTYRRKSDDNFAGGFTGGEYYKVQEKTPQMAVPGGVPYWTDKQVPGGVFPASTVNNEQSVYMIPAPASAYHAPVVRQMPGAPNQGYYAVQRIPSDVYREQQQQQQQQQHQQQHQQQMYNVIPQATMPSMAAAPPTLPPQKAAGYSEGFNMVRPATSGGVGVVTEAGYAQVAYDGGMGRQVIYTTPGPGGVMGAPPPVSVQTAAAAAAQYQAMAGAATADMRPVGALNPEAGGKGVPKATQASV
ncbi:hypothetical protein CDL12_24449 [Handroanthus impetiginosus]|uniref:Uncharacterized protein n=1 Tax=Handroanthus impetiginosus TaxID=429701 RepID=A0A2G9GCM2_9LAMI|nr:hypothetical protein CDL12_24449 [Handroanthus impetiginosus]